MPRFKIPTLQDLVVGLLIGLFFTLPAKLVEHAVTGWIDDLIADYFGWKSPSVGDVVYFIWQWVVPFAAAATVLAIHHYFNNRKWAEIVRKKSLSISATGTVNSPNPALRRKKLLTAGLVFGVFFIGTIVSGVWLYRTYLVTASPKSSASTPLTTAVPSVASPPKEVAAKEFTNRTPRQLLAIYDGRTPFQADKLMEPFKGLWIESEGKILNVLPDGRPNYSVAVLKNDNDTVECRFGPEWANNLARHDKGDTLNFRGKISPNQNGSQLYLLECEVVTPKEKSEIKFDKSDRSIGMIRIVDDRNTTRVIHKQGIVDVSTAADRSLDSIIVRCSLENQKSPVDVNISVFASGIPTQFLSDIYENDKGYVALQVIPVRSDRNPSIDLNIDFNKQGETSAVSQNITSNNQKGGITAHTVNIDPRK